MYIEGVYGHASLLKRDFQGCDDFYLIKVKKAIAQFLSWHNVEQFKASDGMFYDHSQIRLRKSNCAQEYDISMGLQYLTTMMLFPSNEHLSSEPVTFLAMCNECRYNIVVFPHDVIFCSIVKGV